MSKASDKIYRDLNNYVHAMRELGKTPSALYVTKEQWEVLKAASKEGADFKPTYQGLEVRIAK